MTLGQILAIVYVVVLLFIIFVMAWATSEGLRPRGIPPKPRKRS